MVCLSVTGTRSGEGRRVSCCTRSILLEHSCKVSGSFHADCWILSKGKTLAITKSITIGSVSHILNLDVSVSVLFTMERWPILICLGKCCISLYFRKIKENLKISRKRRNGKTNKQTKIQTIKQQRQKELQRNNILDKEYCWGYFNCYCFIVIEKDNSIWGK